MKTLSLIALCGIAAVGQEVERSLPFTQLSTPRDIAEAATVIRSVGEIRNLTADAAERKLTVRGELGQAAMAEWLLARIDRTGSTQHPRPAELEYRPVNGSDVVVRVLYFQGTDSAQNRNELVTVARSVIEIPSAFVSQTAGALVIRCLAGQADAAGWLFDRLDRKVEAGVSDSHRMAGGGDDTIRLFRMGNKVSAEEFHRLATKVRMAAGARRFYTYTPSRILAVRGPEALIGQVAELLERP